MGETIASLLGSFLKKVRFNLGFFHKGEGGFETIQKYWGTFLLTFLLNFR